MPPTWDLNEIPLRCPLPGGLYIHLKQTRFTYWTGGPFDEIKERLWKIKETADCRYICPNKLDKVCFHYDMAFHQDMAYGDFKKNYLKKGVKYDECNGYERVHASMVRIFFDKNIFCATDQINLMNIETGIVSGSVSFIVMENQQLSKKLHKIIIKKIKKHKVYLSFNDNTWKNYLADM